jgi:peptidoglycan/LPS O-acetylase OafA/YrhL
MHAVSPRSWSISTKNSNNFNFLRFLAASLVILSHGIELPTSLASRDWAYQLTGEPFSWYAVNLFFVISGYLIFASWDANPSLAAFAKARCLRILPGLVFMLVLCILVLGLFFSKLDFFRFLSSDSTLRYFAGCLSILFVQMQLPGVFEDNPLSAVNGSLWTLRYEIVCYAGVAILGVIGSSVFPAARRTALLIGIPIAIAATVSIEAWMLPIEGKTYVIYQLARLGLCFLLGGLFREFGAIALLRFELAIALLIVAVFTIRTPAFTPVASVAVAYLGFWCAFVPNNYFCKLTRTAPDYSYGLYIYAFPIQQGIVAIIPDASIRQVIILGFIITLAFAAFSWHFVEKPMLALKKTAIFSRWNSSVSLAQIEAKGPSPPEA